MFVSIQCGRKAFQLRGRFCGITYSSFSSSSVLTPYMCCTHLHNQWQTLRYYFQSLPPTWHFPLHELDQQQQSSPWRQ
jgi:hypothetical protein